MRWLIFGGNGWIGQQVCAILNEQNEEIVYANSRADNENDVENELLNVNPDRVISLIGRTYGPGYTTIDYLEQKGKLVENVKDNLYAPVTLALLCTKHNYHFTYLGTGCIFNGYDGNTGHGYDENALPDFFGSQYSTIKGFTDRLMHFFNDSVLNVRIRMPIDYHMNGRNFITKIMAYRKICSTPNSMTILPELLPIMIDMAKNKETGTVNLTNPGLITHNEILEIVRDIIDPDFTWENFTIEEQSEILLGGRSNNLLSTEKLESLCPHVSNIRDGVIKIVHQLKDELDKTNDSINLNNSTNSNNANNSGN